MANIIMFINACLIVGVGSIEKDTPTPMLCVAVATLVVLMMKNDDEKKK
ncbi:hypothetical protein [Natribacillus halophilus]|nr:hypothetical protein [Natribacillus halophilus]